MPRHSGERSAHQMPRCCFGCLSSPPLESPIPPSLVILPGEAEVVEQFDFVVVATGMYSSGHVHIPEAAGKDRFKGLVMHSSQFRDASVCQLVRLALSSVTTAPSARSARLYSLGSPRSAA